MNFNASIGVCRKLGDSDEIVIIPKDQDLSGENDMVLIINSKEFFKLSYDINKLIHLMEDIKKYADDFDVNEKLK